MFAAISSSSVSFVHYIVGTSTALVNEAYSLFCIHFILFQYAEKPA